ncbi:hypothetical protein [Pseudomonas sp. LS-2]|jgi:hypothetical protein|uniref:hypothetical protein n=1 Tax=Pseudomonas sp. LS-2 TaxID=2315859 RepID=UPI000E73DCA9|nr:hypothetical protein [Pseudomonas sp. LS-2]RJX74949.1 hypothetical protein D3M70_26605 [Pseudomonas sp. LS-2]
MNQASKRHMAEVFQALNSLRIAVGDLEQIELARIEPLEGQQTVDSRQSLAQCFLNLHSAIADIEATLATIGEATGETGKL